jgi:hypothetical protein
MQCAERWRDRERAFADFVDGMASRTIQANKSQTSSFRRFELRLLVANDLLSRSPTSRDLLDSFLTCRAKPNSGILFQPAREVTRAQRTPITLKINN